MPGGIDAVTPLLAWGYQRQASRWHQVLDNLVDTIPVINSCDLLRWNTNKKYLFELAKRGIPIVPTIHCGSLNREQLRGIVDTFETFDLIAKPAVSASADGIFRIDARQPLTQVLSDVLVQPFLPRICKEGELSLIYFSGEFSHAVRKIPAEGDFRVQVQFGSETVRIAPSAELIQFGWSVVQSCPELPAYARVDIVCSESDDALLMEVELIEPDLFLMHANASATQLGIELSSRMDIHLHKS